MRGDDLAKNVGFIIEVERARAKLSQARLAERLGTSQQWLSRVERGASGTTVVSVQRILAALGKQLRVEAVPMHADLDEDIWRGKVQRRDLLYVYLPLLRLLSGLPYAVAGRTAAKAQAAPIVCPLWIDIVLAEAGLDTLAALMRTKFCERWSTKWEDWGYGDRDPREPGANRWHICGVDMRLHVVSTLPSTVEVRIDELIVPVVPLADLERTDAWLHRIMRRWRATGPSDEPRGVRRAGAQP
jgi:transcriptional regulator with XRE-family HTH domain